MRLLIPILVLCASTMLTAQTTRLTDLNEGPANGISEDVRILTTFDNSIVFFDEVDDIRYLFISDGTMEGTKELLNVGSSGWINSVHEIGDFLYANGRIDTIPDRSLVRISKIDHSTEILLESWETISWMQSYNGALYFSGEETNFDNYLYKYDVELEEAVQIFEVYWFGGIYGIGQFKDEIYVMHGVDIDDTMQLSKTTGEPGNQTLIDYFPASSVNRPPLMQAADDYMFFWARSDGNSYSLYKTNGETNSSVLLSDTFEYIPFYDYEERRSFTTIGNNYLFRAREKDGSFAKFFTADGDNDVVEEIVTAESGQDVEGEPEYFVHYNGKVYMKANYAEFFFPAYALFETDGTFFGTRRVLDFDEMPSGYSNDGFGLTSFENRLYYTAYTDEAGRELWSTEGTEESTTQHTDLVPGDASSGIVHLTPVGENLFFFADTPEFGRELYVYQSEDVNTTDVYLEEQIELFPNPVSDWLRIEYTNGSEKMYMISDMHGQQIERGLVQNDRIKVSTLPSGAYILTIKEDGIQKIGRFIKL
ncbi:MAG: T9SS type A sorting domain-containing protein [Bacteroidota bacterium]